MRTERHKAASFHLAKRLLTPIGVTDALLNLRSFSFERTQAIAHVAIAKGLRPVEFANTAGDCRAIALGLVAPESRDRGPSRSDRVVGERKDSDCTGFRVCAATGPDSIDIKKRARIRVLIRGLESCRPNASKHRPLLKWHRT